MPQNNKMNQQITPKTPIYPKQAGGAAARMLPNIAKRLECSFADLINPNACDRDIFADMSNFPDAPNTRYRPTGLHTDDQEKGWELGDQLAEPRGYIRPNRDSRKDRSDETLRIVFLTYIIIETVPSTSVNMFFTTTTTPTSTTAASTRGALWRSLKAIDAKFAYRKPNFVVCDTLELFHE
uniref:Uncharacterized protein n=1 Tax=Panagrellus redivivus TaxID=6233 RepID=A0A7E4V9P7_PANRE